MRNERNSDRHRPATSLGAPLYDLDDMRRPVDVPGHGADGSRTAKRIIRFLLPDYALDDIVDDS